MKKRRPALDPSQLDLGFAVPETAVSDGMLARLPKLVSSAVATMLKGDTRNRYDLAAAVSQLLDEDVSKLMLDAYASEAREDHRISVDRFIALVGATGRYDVLDAILRRIGCTVVTGKDVHVLELGHLEAQRRQIDARIRAIRPEVKPITAPRGRR